MNAITLVAKLFVAACALAGFLAAQPSLRITSPADGTTAHPGELLTVTVDVSPPEGVFRSVYVVGVDPIGNSKERLTAPPYRFTIEIPNGITPGSYYLTAMGFTLSGQPVASNR
jgi:hypothetical protein